jgi:hypothetical protein
MPCLQFYLQPETSKGYFTIPPSLSESFWVFTAKQFASIINNAKNRYSFYSLRPVSKACMLHCPMGEISAAEEPEEFWYVVNLLRFCKCSNALLILKRRPPPSAMLKFV